MFRFTIRELLLVTVIAAVVVVWWIDRKRIADLAQQRDLWTFRAESAADVVRRGGDDCAWNGEQFAWTHIDAAGRRFVRMKERNPSAKPPAITKSAPGFPAAPQQVVTRKPRSGSTSK